jgi:site-specific DNA-methyltransferase (adenine-specific)
VKSVIEIANKKAKGQHPTAKPIDLYKWLIERYSKEEDIVLDPTFGSGNSGLASIELKRKYIGIEKNKRFFDAFNDHHLHHA